MGIELKNMSLAQLQSLVNQYPWFAQARLELCKKMMQIGELGDEQYADVALYLNSRKIVSDLRRDNLHKNYEDNATAKLIKTYTAPQEVHVLGGDYFSQEDYDRVKREEDKLFQFNFKPIVREEESKSSPLSENEVCTETMAQIYLSQGYVDKAKQIYSKLILAYPEKSAYFASLIENLN